MSPVEAPGQRPPPPPNLLVQECEYAANDYQVYPPESKHLRPFVWGRRNREREAAGCYSRAGFDVFVSLIPLRPGAQNFVAARVDPW